MYIAAVRVRVNVAHTLSIMQLIKRLSNRETCVIQLDQTSLLGTSQTLFHSTCELFGLIHSCLFINDPLRGQLNCFSCHSLNSMICLFNKFVVQQSH